MPDTLYCIKWKEPASRIENLAVVNKKGVDKIIEYSKAVNDQLMTSMVMQRKLTEVAIHRQSQKDIYNEMKCKSTTPLASTAKVPRMVTTRSDLQKFDWKSVYHLRGGMR